MGIRFALGPAGVPVLFTALLSACSTPADRGEYVCGEKTIIVNTGSVGLTPVFVPEYCPLPPRVLEYKAQQDTAAEYCKQKGAVQQYADLPEVYDTLTYFGRIEKKDIVTVGEKSLTEYPQTFITEDDVAFEKLPEATEVEFVTLREALQFLSTGKVRALDAKMPTPRSDFANAHRIFPESGSRTSFYRYELMPLGSAKCAPFKAIEERWRAGWLPEDVRAQLNALKASGHCISMRYVAEPEDYNPPGYSYLPRREDIQSEGLNREIETVYDPGGEVAATRQQFWPAIKGSECPGDSAGLVSKLGLGNE